MYILENSFDAYDMIGRDKYSVEMKDKTKYVELIKENKSEIKQYKIKISELESDLLYSKSINIKTFFILLVLKKINFIYYTDKLFFEHKSYDNDNTIVVYHDKTNSVFEDTSLDKLVNICSNSMFMRLHRNYDVTYVQDFKELIDYNKTAMSIVLPDISANPDNVNPTIPLKYGCHMVAMNLQNNDDNMKYYTKFFNDYGTSFVLKEKKLRKIDKIIKLPPLQDPNLSYRDREVKDQHYDLRI